MTWSKQPKSLHNSFAASESCRLRMKAPGTEQSGVIFRVHGEAVCSTMCSWTGNVDFVAAARPAPCKSTALEMAFSAPGSAPGGAPGWLGARLGGCGTKKKTV